MVRSICFSEASDTDLAERQCLENGNVRTFKPAEKKLTVSPLNIVFYKCYFCSG